MEDMILAIGLFIRADWGPAFKFHLVVMAPEIENEVTFG